MRLRLIMLPLVAFMLFGGVYANLAQPGAATCAPLVTEALTRLGDNCDGLGRNSACYGYTLVQAALADEADDVLFNEPRDRAELVQVNTLRTAPLDEATAVWGIAVMNTQANLPGTLPGQGVVMLLMGEGEITNSVNPADLPTLTPVTGVVVDTGAFEGVRVRTGAGLGFNINGVAPAGTEVQVDARTEDGAWVRVNAGDSFGWMFAELVDLRGTSVDALPVLEDEIQSPMQAFYFRSGVGNTECNEAPDALMIQSPRGGQVSLTVNESEIVIGSTVVFETIGDNLMVIYVVDGTAIVNNLIVPAGFKAFAPIAPQDETDTPEDDETDAPGTGGVTIVSGERLAVTGPWETCEPISDADREWLGTLTEVPDALLNYPVSDAPDALGICASPEEVQQAAAEAFTAQQESNPAAVDCTGFAGTSPTDGMNWGEQTFYWDPVNSGNVTYAVRVFDENGAQVASGATDGATTTTVNTGAGNPAGGVSYTWDVVALDAEGNVACTTAPLTLQRGARPEPEPSDDDDDDDSPDPTPEATEEPEEPEPEITAEPEPEITAEPEPECPPAC